MLARGKKQTPLLRPAPSTMPATITRACAPVFIFTPCSRLIPSKPSPNRLHPRVIGARTSVSHDDTTAGCHDATLGTSAHVAAFGCGDELLDRAHEPITPAELHAQSFQL